MSTNKAPLDLTSATQNQPPQPDLTINTQMNLFCPAKGSLAKDYPEASSTTSHHNHEIIFEMSQDGQEHSEEKGGVWIGNVQTYYEFLEGYTREVEKKGAHEKEMQGKLLTWHVDCDDLNEGSHALAVERDSSPRLGTHEFTDEEERQKLYLEIEGQKMDISKSGKEIAASTRL